MDEWLLAHLIDIGAISADGISRKARAGRCATCHRRTLTGLDADRAAGVACVDSREIGPVGEAVAIAGGLPTYTMRFIGGRWELDLRSRWEIEGGNRRWPMYAKHRCDALHVPPDTIHPKLLRYVAVAASRALSDTPPF